MAIGMRLLYASLAIVSLALSAIAQTETWPTKPIHWIQSGAPGSSPDIIGRIMSDRLGAIWGQPIITDNRPGAAGNIAAQAAARSTPDGYNYFFGFASTLAVNPYTFKSLPFDVERDFVPIINLGVSPFMIAVNSELPVGSMSELIALAKSKPGKLSYATSGSRNLQHITGEMLKSRADIDILNVPYRSSPFAAQDTIAGRTEIYIDSVPAMAGHVSGGKLRVIGVTSKNRLPGFENIPTVAEAVPNFTAFGWFALLAPAGTPPDVLARVNKDLNSVLKLDEVTAVLHRNGVFDGGGSIPEMQEFLRSERVQWGEAVRKAGIQPE